MCLTLQPRAVRSSSAQAVVFLDRDEFKSTWLGNKSIYRTRMAMADGGELIVMAPGVSKFGEDPDIDALIRRVGEAVWGRMVWVGALFLYPRCDTPDYSGCATSGVWHSITEYLDRCNRCDGGFWFARECSLYSDFLQFFSHLACCVVYTSG